MQCHTSRTLFLWKRPSNLGIHMIHVFFGRERLACICVIWGWGNIGKGLVHIAPRMSTISAFLEPVGGGWGVFIG